MPSTKKRINLTVPDSVYQQLKRYMNLQGIDSDATACLMLIRQQLNGLEGMTRLKTIMDSMPVENLMQLTKEGYKEAKEMLSQFPKAEKQD